MTEEEKDVCEMTKDEYISWTLEEDTSSEKDKDKKDEKQEAFERECHHRWQVGKT